jgi:hypothetical protein
MRRKCTLLLNFEIKKNLSVQSSLTVCARLKDRKQVPLQSETKSVRAQRIAHSAKTRHLRPKARCTYAHSDSSFPMEWLRVGGWIMNHLPGLEFSLFRPTLRENCAAPFSRRQSLTLGSFAERREGVRERCRVIIIACMQRQRPPRSAP